MILKLKIGMHLRFMNFVAWFFSYDTIFNVIIIRFFEISNGRTHHVIFCDI